MCDKLRLISWHNTCMPVKHGGIGFVSFKALNFAYYCTLILRIYNSQSPIACWIKASYDSVWKPIHHKVSCFWSNIMTIATSLKS